MAEQVDAGFFSGERILENANPVYYGYWYLADGRPHCNTLPGQSTVAVLRETYPHVQEWRYANLVERGLPAV